MDFSLIFKYLPLIMKAISAAQTIQSAVQTGASVTSILEHQGPAVLDLVKEAGSSLFPNLNPDQQLMAGAQRFAPVLTRKIQTQLNDLGFHVVIDGAYGPSTRSAVMAFQTRNNLEVDGWAGPKTQAALDAAK